MESPFEVPVHINPVYTVIHISGCACSPFLGDYDTHRLETHSADCCFRGTSLITRAISAWIQNEDVSISRVMFALMRVVLFFLLQLRDQNPSFVPSAGATTSYHKATTNNFDLKL